MVATNTLHHQDGERIVTDEHEEVGGANDEVQEGVLEKLQDDDQLAEPLYKRVFFTIFPRLRRGM